MKIKTSILLSIILIFSVFSSASAEGNRNVDSREKNIKEIKEYIEKNVPSIIASLQELNVEDATLSNIEKTIETYYKENPAPSAANDPALSLAIIFPGEVKEMGDEYQHSTLNINDFLSTKKEIKNKEDNIITFKDNYGSIDVYISSLGEIFILETRQFDEPSQKQSIVQNVPLNTWNNTSTSTTTGIGYNALGFKLFTLTASGSFRYNGSDVQTLNSDGNWERHFWGSTLDISERALGASRTIHIGNYKYAEVYSRLYFEGGIGVRWAQFVLNSATVEVNVGSTVTGNLYGAAVTI
ncbi:hypothetical protein ACFOQM_14490 [Paenibacillus sp. GCM10012307]|uniref:Uncharacterized protein n=1 Tax=Paenibacillus roseus TaxID=2798579 RepID=A0A934MPV2_9BACL|nr:hypothetical protein [Paenibacillus roseus]MBJ6362471.1 hypothetical protein [Paenibacillus roseus]